MRVRWEKMSGRWLRKVEDFWTVTREVWRRRDDFLLECSREQTTKPADGSYYNEKVQRDGMSFVPRFHWTGVMKEWGWELLF